MVNSGISTDDRRDAQDQGWHGCLDELERVLAGCFDERADRMEAGALERLRELLVIPHDR
jgi:hypothetical protein